MKPRVLFLCMPLSGYFNACIRYLREHKASAVRVYHWPAAGSAPFHIELPNIEVIEKTPGEAGTLVSDCIDYNPSIIYVGGWVDKDYLEVARIFKKKGIPVVGGIDNAWKGTFRQQLSRLLAGKLVRPYYTHLWVAGSRQYEFARRLGFSHRHIIHDLYIADVNLFEKDVKSKYNKILLFAGRLEKEKGIDILCNAFNSLSPQQRNGWKLSIVGSGSLQDRIRSTEFISVKPFMQPEELKEYTKDAGGFILPSLKEPWGVVVQEFAAARLPLLLSDEVNAAEKYLIHGYNGYLFKNNDAQNLVKTLIHFFSLPDSEYPMMGERSHQLAMTNNHEIWASRLLSVCGALEELNET